MPSPAAASVASAFGGPAPSRNSNSGGMDMANAIAQSINSYHAQPQPTTDDQEAGQHQELHDAISSHPDICPDCKAKALAALPQVNETKSGPDQFAGQNTSFTKSAPMDTAE